jgi:hypothetical protein
METVPASCFLSRFDRRRPHLQQLALHALVRPIILNPIPRGESCEGSAEPARGRSRLSRCTKFCNHTVNTMRLDAGRRKPPRQEVSGTAERALIPASDCCSPHSYHFRETLTIVLTLYSGTEFKIGTTCSPCVGGRQLNFAGRSLF